MKISINNIEVESEDIDLIVRYVPLATIDKELVSDRELLTLLPKNDTVRPYWETRIKNLEAAREIAEYCLINDIPTVDLPKKERDRTQGLYALEMTRTLEKRYTDQQYHLKYLQDKVSALEEKLSKVYQNKDRGYREYKDE